jgi:hypothetical protein
MSWNETSVAESLAVMVQKETAVYNKRYDYLGNPSCAQGVVSEDDRTKMVDWCYKVVDTCQLERETVAIAMDLVDRFLSNKSSTAAMDVLGDRIQFQLLSLTALYVSIKISQKIALGSDFFSVISRELYPVKDIEAMELILLKELSWCISPPTCVQMAHHILTLSSTLVCFDKASLAALLNDVDYQAECAVRDYYFVTQRPSTLAMAAIINSVDRIEGSQERQDIIRAVLSVTKYAEFESIEVILATRIKLHSLVYGHDDSGDGRDGEVDDEDGCDVEEAQVDDAAQWYLY